MNGAADFRKRWGFDWARESAWPNFPLELDGWTAVCRSHAPDSPDPAALFMAGTVAAVLAHTAAGRDGLAILADFLAPGFNGHTTAAMLRRGMDWTHVQEKRRRATLRRLGHAAADAAAVLRSQTGTDPADVAADVEEAQVEIADYRACRQSSMPLGLCLWSWASPLPAVKAWRRMLSAFRAAYPWRDRPLTTPRAVAIERAKIAKAVRHD